MNVLRPLLPHALTLVGSAAFCLLKLFPNMALSQSPVLSGSVSINQGIRSPSGRMEPLVLAAAKESGVQKIVSVLKRPDGKSIELEWDGDLASTLRFMDELERRRIVGRCALVRIARSTTAAARVRTQATFSLAGVRSLDRHSSFEIAKGIDVFEHPTSGPSLVARPHRLPKLYANAAALSAAKARQEETERLAAKKQELESQLKLTGIVNQGRETVAFMSVEGPEAKNLMIRIGDTIRDARVVSIDASKGELRLDYAGKIEVLVKLRLSQGT